MYWFPDEFEKYCSDVEHTTAWGGQLEVSSFVVVFVVSQLFCLLGLTVIILFTQQLKALTQVLHLPIEVIQADSPAIKLGEEYDGEPITLMYVLLLLYSDFLNLNYSQYLN